MSPREGSQHRRWAVSVQGRIPTSRGDAGVSLGGHTWDYLQMWFFSASFVLYPFLYQVFPFLSWGK